MANTIELGVDLVPKVDAAAAKKAEQAIDSIPSTVVVEATTDEFVDQIEEAIAQVEKALEDIDGLDLDTSEAIDALQKLQEAADGIGDIDFESPDAAPLKELMDSYDQMKKSLTDQVAAQQKLLIALKASGQEGTDAYHQQAEGLRQLKAKLKEVTDAENEFNESLHETEQRSNGLHGNIGKIVALDALSDTFASITETGGAYREELERLQAQTGAMGQELDNLKAQAEDVFVRGIGENAAEGIKIIGQARQAFGGAFADDQLTDLTVSLGRTGKAFEKEFGEIATQAASFQKSFNTDATKTAQLVTFAMKEANSVAGDALETIGKFSPLMRQAGYDAEEFVGTLANASGAFQLEKVADSIKEVGIRLKSGDVTKGIDDLVVNFSDRIPEALSRTLSAVAQEGQAGLKSTKEVLQESTASIEQAFKDGKIDTNIRQALQAAFAGSKANELGGELYARIFGAPIDKALIEARAAAAQATIDNAFEPTIADKIGKQFDVLKEKSAAAMVPLAKGFTVAAAAAKDFSAIKTLIPEETFNKMAESLQKTLAPAISKLGPQLASLGPALANPVVLGVAAAGAALALFFTQTKKGQEIWAGIKERVEQFWETVKPLVMQLGSILEEVGGIVVDVLLMPTELLMSAWEGVFELVSSFFASSQNSELGRDLSAIGEVFEKVKISLAGLSDAFVVFKDTVGGAIKKLFSGDIIGAFDEVKNMGPKLAKAFNEGVNRAARDIKVEKLQKAVSAGFDVKEKLDKNDSLKKLVADYEKAADDITKRNLAKQIAEQVPGAVAGLTTTVDQATGMVVESYDIALDKAKQYTTDQETILSKSIANSEQAFVQLLNEQVKAGEEGQKKLQDIANQLVSATDPKQIAALTEEYDKQKKVVEENAEAIKGVVTQGRGIGVSSEDVKKLATSMGASQQEADLLSARMKTVDKEVRTAAVGAKVLGEAFQQAMARAQASVDTAAGAILGAGERLRDLRRQLKEAQSDEERQRIKQDIDDTQASLKRNSNELNGAVRENVRLTRTKAELDYRIERQSRTQLQIEQEALAKKQAQLDLDLALFQVVQDRFIIEQRRSRTAVDDLALANETYDTQYEKLVNLADAYGLTKAQVEELVASVKETGSLKIEDIAIKLSLVAGEKAGKAGLKQEIADALVGVEQSDVNRLSIKLQAEIEYREWFQQLREAELALEEAQLQLKVNLGLESPVALVELAGKRVEETQRKIAEVQARMAKESARLSLDGLTEAQRAATEQVIREQTLLLTQLRTEEAAGQQAVIDAIRNSYAEREALIDAHHAFEMERLQERNTLVLALYAAFNDQVLANRQAALDEMLQMEVENIDAIAGYRTEQADEMYSKELKALQQQQSVQALSERQALQATLDLQKRIEEEKRRIEEEAQRQREEAQREADKRRLIAEQSAAAERLLIEAEAAQKELDLQREVLAERLAIAKEKAAASGTREDNFAAKQIERELGEVEGQLAKKSHAVLVLSETLQGGLQETIGNLFTGSDEQIADSFRKMFGTLAGALKKAASAFVIDIVLTSPWVKSAIGVNPLLGGVVTGAITAVLNGLVGAILDPVLSGLLSFSTGGRVDSPTLAIVGDAARLGGGDREWIFRDDQLWTLVSEATERANKRLVASMERIVEAIESERIVGELGASTLYLVARKGQAEVERRTRG